MLKHCPVFLDDKEVLPGTETPVNHLHPDQEWYTTDVFTDYALHFMDESFKEHADQPLFLYLAYNAPHFPLHAREEDTKKYRGRFRDVGWDKLRQERYNRMVKLGLIKKEWALSPLDAPKWETYDAKLRDELDFKMALYAAIIDRMDQNIGRVVKKLKDAGRLDNALILFMVDNGVPGTGVHDWRGLFAKSGKHPETRVDNYKEWARRGGWSSSSGRGWANLSNRPFPHVQALHPRGWRGYTSDRPLANRREGSRRVAPYAQPPHRYCAHLPRCSGPEERRHGRRKFTQPIYQGPEARTHALLGTRREPCCA